MFEPVNATVNEIELDVRPMAPRDRHPTIFNLWAKLANGESFLLTNDHDPLPLYYQLACEHTGTCLLYTSDAADE